MAPPSESSAPAASFVPRMFCRKCGYSLFGLKSRICPECGRPFDPADRRTFARNPPRGWVWRWGRRVIALLLLLTLTASAGIGWLWWGWHAEQPTIARLRATYQRFRVAPIAPKQLRWVLGARWAYIADRVDSAELWNLKEPENQPLGIGSLSQIQTLELYDCELTNFELSRLARLHKLRSLHLFQLQNERPDFAFLEQLPALSSLEMEMWYGPIDKRGLEHIGRLKQLKVLRLERAGLKDADLQLLQGLCSLEQLDLRGNPLSEAGLAHLQGLKSLRVLYLDAGLPRSPDVAELQQAIRGLQVRE